MCVVNDGMVEIYSAIQMADVLVLSTPLYFSGMSSQMKAVIDRCQCLWQRARRHTCPSGKTGYLLAVGAMENANFRNVLSEVRSFYIGIGIDYRGDVLVPGVETDGDIRSRVMDLEKAYQLGRASII